jgi:uncharacterized protein (TIGR03437 family)
LTLHQSRYRLRAGESTGLDTPPETLDFLLHAKARRVEIVGNAPRGIVVAPNRAGDQILVAVSLAMRPGEYTLTLSATAEAGEKRDATLSVTVDALTPVPSNATQPPVILLNGWQAPGLASSCPPSPASQTFGVLENNLTQSPPLGDNVPVVYWFDNCAACPNCSIETLGNDLAQVIASIRYDNATPVPQVDLIAHSMGGLIIRSYLSGKQTTSGVFDPLINPKVRKAIFIATPHFGSFQADNPAADLFFFAGSQTNEMKPGSQFLFDLAKWNQFQDDLRGTDALGIIGNAGSYNGAQGASDGVVSLTSASLKLTSFSDVYAEPDVRTRIVDYCHSDFTGTVSSVVGSLLGCIGPGIAYIDTNLHPTYQIIQSFLANTETWTTIGTPPSLDPYLSAYGGVMIGAKSANDQFFTNLTSVTAIGTNLSFASGPSNSVSSLFYDEWVRAGNYELALYDSNGELLQGNLSAIPGGGMAIYIKDSPTIRSVGPLANTPGLTVSAGSTIIISGVGFGSQLCSGCQVLAGVPGSTTAYILPVSSWSDQAISAAFVPATLPNLPIPGYVTIYVELSSSAWDSINIMAAPASTIAVAPTSLQFAYTVGGTVPAAQSVQVTNSGGTLTWSAITSAPWLSVVPASGTARSAVSVLVSPASLSAGIHAGFIQVSATGASNTPVLISVTLTVAPAPASLAVSPQALAFNYTVGGTVPAAQGISITNTGGGTLSWAASASAAWVGLSSASGTVPVKMSVSVSPVTLAAGSYSATVLITATGATGSPASVSVTLVVQAPQPTVNITSVANGASFQAGFASATWVSIFGTNLSQTTRKWQNSDFVNGLLPTSLSGVSATINGLPAYVEYISPTQVNVLAPDDATVGAVQVQVTTAQGKSNSLTAQKQQFAPAFFTIGGSSYVAAQHADYSYVGKPGLTAGATPAKPGEVIILYGTGFGPTNPPLPSAQLVTTPAVLANSVQVTIGGVPVQPPIYAGLVEAGLYQFNVTVPNVPGGDAAVVAQIGGVQTQTGVSITIQQ